MTSFSLPAATALASLSHTHEKVGDLGKDKARKGPADSRMTKDELVAAIGRATDRATARARP